MHGRDRADNFPIENNYYCDSACRLLRDEPLAKLLVDILIEMSLWPFI